MHLLPKQRPAWVIKNERREKSFDQKRLFNCLHLFFFFFFDWRKQKKEAWKSWMTEEVLGWCSAVQPCPESSRSGRQSPGTSGGMPGCAPVPCLFAVHLRSCILRVIVHAVLHPCSRFACYLLCIWFKSFIQEIKKKNSLRFMYFIVRQYSIYIAMGFHKGDIQPLFILMEV